jgi:hypothetical protein
MNARGILTFLAKNSPKPIYQASVGGAEARLELAGTYNKQPVDILNGRKLQESFSLDKQGFQLVESTTAVEDLYDAELGRKAYEAECKEMILNVTGANSAYVFDHTLRSGDSKRREEKNSREPTTVIHNDYTPHSAPKRLRDFMGSDAEKLMEKPFCIVNLWRPIKQIESFPLAVCDAESVAPETLIYAERRSKDRIGEIIVVRFDPNQRWIYFPNMTPDEILLIKTYDSREDGRARWCLHTAVDIENTDANAAPRESIESRIFAFGI